MSLEIIKEITLDALMTDRGAFHFDAETRELMIQKGILLISNTITTCYLTIKKLKIEIDYNADAIEILKDDLIKYFRALMEGEVYVHNAVNGYNYARFYEVYDDKGFFVGYNDSVFLED